MYTHQPLGRDVETMAGYYTPEQEVRLAHEGREVLYVTGQVVIEATCCVSGSCRTANYWYGQVIGYIVRWQGERNERGLPVTEVELVRDPAAQDTIRVIILKTAAASRVDFW